MNPSIDRGQEPEMEAYTENNADRIKGELTESIGKAKKKTETLESGIGILKRHMEECNEEEMRSYTIVLGKMEAELEECKKYASGLETELQKLNMRFPIE